MIHDVPCARTSSIEIRRLERPSKFGYFLTRQGCWSRVRYAAHRAKVPTGVHILRHTFCSHLAMQGAPMRGAQELAGHQSLAMTQRYSHLALASLDSTIRLFDNRPIRRAVRDNLETPESRNS